MWLGCHGNQLCYPCMVLSWRLPWLTSIYGRGPHVPGLASVGPDFRMTMLHIDILTWSMYDSEQGWIPLGRRLQKDSHHNLTGSLSCARIRLALISWIYLGTTCGHARSLISFFLFELFISLVLMRHWLDLDSGWECVSPLILSLDGIFHLRLAGAQSWYWMRVCLTSNLVSWWHLPSLMSWSSILILDESVSHL